MCTCPSSVFITLTIQNFSYRKQSYTDPEQLSMFCGTYNVNGKANMGTEGLNKWLFPEGSGLSKDIYVIGFQVSFVCEFDAK